LDFALIINPLAAIMSSKTFFSVSRDNDIQTIEKLMPLEEIKRDYNPASVNYILSNENFQKNFHQLTDKDLGKINTIYYRGVLNNFPAFMADRVFVLFSTLSGNHYVISNDIRDGNHFKYAFIGKNIARSIQFDTIDERLLTLQDGLIHYLYSELYRLTLGTNYWSFLILILCFLAYKWLPSTALFSLLILLQVPFMFLVQPSADFRYYYFIYLSFFIITPLALADYRISKYLLGEKTSYERNR